MAKKFKSHKKKNKKISKLLLFLVMVLIVVNISFNAFYKEITKHISEKDIINLFIKHENKNKIFPDNGIDFVVNYTLGVDLKNKKDDTTKMEVLPTMKEEVITFDEPLVYIYNTHQTEEYRVTNINDYNVIPTVMHASLILQDRLNNLGIKSMVETNSIKEKTNPA